MPALRVFAAWHGHARIPAIRFPARIDIACVGGVAARRSLAHASWNERVSTSYLKAPASKPGLLLGSRRATRHAAIRIRGKIGRYVYRYGSQNIRNPPILRLTARWTGFSLVGKRDAKSSILERRQGNKQITPLAIASNAG